MTKSNYKYIKEVKKTFNGRMRKQLIILDVKGKTWETKKELVHKKLIKSFYGVPNGVSFHKRKTSDLKNNPDGLRLFVKCSWIKRNRFDDKNGVFHVGSLIQAINRQIEGKTKDNILA